MPSFNRVQLTGTDYQKSATIQDVFGGKTSTPGGAFNVENGNAWYQLQYPLQISGDMVNVSGYGLNDWTSEVLLTPGSGPIPPGVLGIRFRNDDANFPATVSAAIPEPNTPVLVLSTVGSVAATMIGGSVDSTGAIVSGRGFLVNKTGTGVYQINFTTSFSAVPLVLATAIDAASTTTKVCWATVSAAGVSSVTVRTYVASVNVYAGGGGIAATDAAFDFTAQAAG